MEQDEITRRNVAIAEYMGWEYLRTHTDGLMHWLLPENRIGTGFEACFASDWSVLMPAVEKIMGEFSENIHSWLPMSSDNPKMFHSKLHGAFWLIEGMDKPLIQRVWFVVSEYVLALKS